MLWQRVRKILRKKEEHWLGIVSPDVHRVVAPVSPDVTRDWPCEAATCLVYVPSPPTPIWEHHNTVVTMITSSSRTKHEGREWERIDARQEFVPLSLPFSFTFFVSSFMTCMINGVTDTLLVLIDDCGTNDGTT